MNKLRFLLCCLGILASSCSEKANSDLTIIGMLVLLRNPDVRISNTAGSTINYQIMIYNSSVTCSGTVVQTASSIASGTITQYMSTAPGRFEFYYGPFPGGCLINPPDNAGWVFVRGTSYTCTHSSTSPATMACSVP